MDYITPEHPFFSVDNIATLLRLVETRVLEASGETIRFEANEEFVQQMHTAAQQYPQYLITATYQEGVDRLNDLIARRAVAALTEVEEAGQYTPHNILYQQTRKTRRYDDGARDHDRQASAVILGGNVFKKRTDALRRQVQETQNAYLNNPVDLKFVATQPRLYEDAKFRHL
jgi:hypothetical protein